MIGNKRTGRPPHIYTRRLTMCLHDLASYRTNRRVAGSSISDGQRRLGFHSIIAIIPNRYRHSTARRCKGKEVSYGRKIVKTLPVGCPGIRVSGSSIHAESRPVTLECPHSAMKGTHETLTDTVTVKYPLTARLCTKRNAVSI